MKKPISKPIPSQGELCRLFTYHSVSGELIWNARRLSDFANDRRHRSWNKCISGKVAGNLRKYGYVYVTINNLAYSAHRLIWTMIFGEIPIGMQIDHINGIRNDNRIENLRLATPSQNQRNRKMNAHNKSGATGVSWRESHKKWRAQAGGKEIGKFLTKEEAVDAVQTYRLANGFSVRHGT